MTDSILFLVLSMLIIAASLYLPEHVSTIANRIFYYCFGDEDSLGTASKAASQVFAASSNMLREATTQFLGSSNGGLSAADSTASSAGVGAAGVEL